MVVSVFIVLSKISPENKTLWKCLGIAYEVMEKKRKQKRLMKKRFKIYLIKDS